MTTTPNNIHAWITQGLTCEHLQVEGDGHHFEALVVSAAFEGLATVRRHQLVYQALGEHMHTDIHALSMRTLTPAEHKQANG